MRTILAGIGGVFATVIGLIIVFLVGGEDRNEVASASPDPDVIAERQAPATRNNPMAPVTNEEAARRSELHETLAQGEAATSLAVMAPSVVTEVRAASDDDALSRELFGDLPSTPEPTAVKPEPEPEPEPDEYEEFVETLPEPEPEPEVGPKFNPAQYRDRFRTNVDRPSNSFGTQNFQFDSGFLIDPETVRQLVGDADVFEIAEVQDDGWFEPFQVADGYGTGQGLTDPVVVRPQYDFNTGGIYPQGPTGYGAPRMNERSAARPAMTNVDQYGQPYTTSNEPNPYLAGQGGPIVLARSGDMVMAHLRYGFNSDDVRGLPIYAKISDFLPNGSVGPLNGAQVEGQIAYSNYNAAILFEKLIMPNGREHPISAIAVSVESGRTGVAQHVNRHIWSRYGSLFLAGMIEGIGEVGLAQLDNSGDTIIINTGDGTASGADDEYSTGEIVAGALAPIGRNMSSAAAQGFNRSPTISAENGMPFALVFTDTAVSDPAQARTAFNPRSGQMEVVGMATPDPAETSPVSGSGQQAPSGPAGSAETFTPAANGPPNAVWQSLGAASRNSQ